MRMNKFFPAVLFCFAVCLFAFAEDEVILDSEISRLEQILENTTSKTERKVLLMKIARYQEFSNLFPEAESSYVKISQLSTSEEQIQAVLNAARCSLSYGNSTRCDELLSSIASSARTGEYAPLLKLYAVWSWISKCTSYEETYEPVAILKSYLELDSMKTVRQQMLFTLFYITGQVQYAAMLKNEFPQSMEYGIICGTVELAPTPFWFFSCRKLPDSAELAKITGKSEEKQAPAPKRTVTKLEGSKEVLSPSKKNESTEVLYYQLGFFSSMKNAQNLVDRTKEKNIDAQIKQVVKPSGNTYYMVFVKSNDPEMGKIIKNSGFECYPVFEEEK